MRKISERNKYSVLIDKTTLMLWGIAILILIILYIKLYKDYQYASSKAIEWGHKLLECYENA